MKAVLMTLAVTIAFSTAANAAALRKQYECQAIKGSPLKMSINLRQDSTTYYSVSNGEKVIDSATPINAVAYQFSAGQAQVNDRRDDSPNGKLLGLILQKGKAVAYHYGLKTYFDCE